MESIYLQELDENTTEIIIRDNDIINHIKALRLRNNENVLVSNGNGISAIGNIILQKNNFIFKVKAYNELNLNENNFNLSILISSLDNRERMEFAIEKSVELGVNRIFVCSTQHSGKKYHKIERLEAKVLAAYQQSMRTILPKVIFFNDLFDIYTENHYFSEVYIADISGENLFEVELKKNSLIVVGPEGGLSDEETKFFKQKSNTKFFALGEIRLRAETAVISSISVFNYKFMI